MRPELIIAEKEFRDHIMSKRFIAILAILLMLSAYGVVTGMDAYNQKLEQYKNPQGQSDPMRQELIASYQEQIADLEERGDSEEYAQLLREQLNRLTNPPMPSVLEVFSGSVILFTFVGMILGVSMGFDLISRERDEGSLKSLVSSPIYRDAIINGKAIGAVMTLALAMGITFIVTIAILLFKGAVPGLEELLRLAAYFVSALLYCSVFFSIAMMMSALTKSTAMSILSTVGVVFLLVIFSVVSLILSSMVAAAIMGPAPTMSLSPISTNVSDASSNPTGSFSLNDDYMDYYRKQAALSYTISEIVTTVSPINDFGGMMGLGVGGIGGTLLSKQDPTASLFLTGPMSDRKDLSLLDSLSLIWVKLLALIVETVVALGITYWAFMRIDVR